MPFRLPYRQGRLGRNGTESALARLSTATNFLRRLAGWISTEQMIGQSGKTIAPQLLITLGVSGAAQFTTSVLNSRFILAIDKNPRSPIFEMADIGIVGDLQEVLPLLIRRLKAVKGKTP